MQVDKCLPMIRMSHGHFSLVLIHVTYGLAQSEHRILKGLSGIWFRQELLLDKLEILLNVVLFGLFVIHKGLYNRLGEEFEFKEEVDLVGLEPTPLVSTVILQLVQSSDINVVEVMSVVIQ